MYQNGFEYTAKASIYFYRNDIEKLIEIGLHHYDGWVQSTCNPGGFIYGMSNYLTNFDNEAEGIERSLSFRELDTICKLLEMSGNDYHALELYTSSRLILTALNKEQVRMMALSEKKEPGDVRLFAQSEDKTVGEDTEIPF